MLKLNLTTHSKNEWSESQSVFIYAGEYLIKELHSGTSSSVSLDYEPDDLHFIVGQTQQRISLAKIKSTKLTTLQLTADLSIQLRVSHQIKLLDYTNLILASLSALLAIGYSFSTDSDWSEFLFILGSTVLVVLLFMLLYGHPINARNYNIRMYAAISALILIFILIPLENWTLKTLIGLSTLTVITRFIKGYQRSLSVVYDAFAKQ
ncbi:hypothetical protein [Myroides sp. DW712]|uniref:hypothetical protein n=1 Tax=Myroides sp. DW712 TaxID=3389800 RepID=UPI00397E607E